MQPICARMPSNWLCLNREAKLPTREPVAQILLAQNNAADALVI